MRSAARRAVQVTVVGLAALVGLGFEWLARRLTGRRETVAPRRLRRTLELLGPTFMKLGQVLSTRPDLVTPAFEAELSRLQDAGPPIPWPEVDRAVTRSLGQPPASAYGAFTREPLAVASIGQVHAARLVDGTDVVVKVRRPGVVDAIAVDLRLMSAVARVVARLPAARRFDPVGLSTEFAATITAELDYLREGQNAERLADELHGEAGVQIPSIVWDRTREDVLTETRIVGAKIDDVVAIERAGLDRAVVARAFAEAYLTMVFVHRFFHADPHPGNVFVRDDGVIGFVDFGMVGEVDDATGRGLVTVLTALVAADAAQLAGALLDLGVAGAEHDRAGLERDLRDLLDRYGDVALQDLSLTAVVGDLMAVVRRRDLQLPSRIALLLKTVVMCEGVAARLDPGFRLVPVLVPYGELLTRAPGDREAG
jgi:ubiquinone biosynthesis protein